MNFSVKRAYDQPDAEDGTRILVDRLWPRGLSRENAKIDVWLKSVAPSDALRKWYGHDPEKWLEFRRLYFAELDSNADSVNALVEYVRSGRTTLLYASREPACNNAVALRDYIRRVVT